MAQGDVGTFPEVPDLRVLAEIGRGSFGRVYKAVEPDNGRHVAVKVLTGAVLDAAALRQFERERRAAGALSVHPNIVTVHRSGLDEGGRPYLVMELAPGRTLADRLRDSGPLPAPAVADIGVKLAGAVATAHRIDVLHCDIKPENVLVGAAGEPLLADFGISRLAGGGSSSMGRAGTFAYSAPEVFKGEPIAATSDVFALGATLYALASGTSPFMADQTSSQQAVMYRIVNEEPADLRILGVPDALAAVITRAMAKDPRARYQSATELGEALQGAQPALGVGSTTMVVSEVALPPADGTIPLLAARGPGVARSDSPTVTGWRRPSRILAAVTIAAVAALAATLVVLATGGDGNGRLPLVEVAGSPDAKTSATVADAPTTTAGAPTATVATPPTVLPAVSRRSESFVFLGTRVERAWSLPAGQDRVEVTLTLTNVSARPLRWHHDEIVTADLAPTFATVTSNPPAEVLEEDRVLRWWPDLAPNGQLSVTYHVARGPAWPPLVTAEVLASWDTRRIAPESDRQAMILRNNNLTDRVAAPGSAPAAVTPATTAPPGGGGTPANPGGQNPGGNQPQVTTSPPTVTPTTAPQGPAAPTVSISGPTEVCAGRRSDYVGNATGAVSGLWSLPGFTMNAPVWAPGSPNQWVEPQTGAIGNTYTWTLQVTSSSNAAASAQLSFVVVDCDPVPTVSISGPIAVCAFQRTYFSGAATNATSGGWTINGGWNITDSGWTPSATQQWVEPAAAAIGYSYTWTLTVYSDTGRAASAQHTFSVYQC